MYGHLHTAEDEKRLHKVIPESCKKVPCILRNSTKKKTYPTYTKQRTQINRRGGKRVNGCCNKQTDTSEGKQHRGKLNKPYLTSGHQHSDALHFSALRERTRVCSSLSGELKQGLKRTNSLAQLFPLCVSKIVTSLECPDIVSCCWLL